MVTKTPVQAGRGAASPGEALRPAASPLSRGGGAPRDARAVPARRLATILAAPMRLALILPLLAAASSHELPTSPAGRSAGAPAAGALSRAEQPGLRFVANGGQWPAAVRLGAMGPGASAWVLADGFAQRFERWSPRAPGKAAAARTCSGAVVRTRFAGAAGRVAGEEPDEARFHFLRGGGSATAAAFGRARIRDLYPGVDLVLRPHAQSGSALAYDLHLGAGADLDRVTAECEGARALALAADGSLCVEVPLPGGGSVELRQSPPVAWQPGAGGDRPVEVAFQLLGGCRYGFRAGDRDPAAPLVIDPGIVWSTLLGGGESDSVGAMRWVPGHGIWVGGFTSSADFPATPGAFQTAGAGDAFVARLAEDGATLVWATFLGGSEGEEVRGLAVDGTGAVSVVGWTRSADFPVVPGALQPAYAGASAIVDIGDGFYARLSADGADLLGGTFLGGELDDIAEGVDLADGDAFVAGWTSSPDFPTTPGAFQRALGGPVTLQSDGFVARLSSDGRSARYATYLGGRFADVLLDVRADAGGRATVTGHSLSADFPTTQQAFQPQSAGANDAVVVRLAPDGGTQLWSTYVGGTGTDAGLGLALVGDGSVWIAGSTQSGDFPTTPGALQTVQQGFTDGFLLHLSPDGRERTAATLLGGPGADVARAVALAPGGLPVVVGDTAGGLPLPPGAPQPVHGGGSQDAFVLQLLPAADGLRFGTYLGGLGEDFLVAVQCAADGLVLAGGYTFAADFPTTPGVAQPHLLGVEDGVVAMLDPEAELSGSLRVSGTAPPAVAFEPGERVDVLALHLANLTPRALAVESVRLFVGGTGDAARDLAGVSLWRDDPAVPGPRDELLVGPEPWPAAFGERTLPLTGLAPLDPGAELRLTAVLHTAPAAAAGAEFQAAVLGAPAWTVRAAGAGPAVTVASQARLAGAVATASATAPFPVDLDGDGRLTVGDLRRLCLRLGSPAAGGDDPDGDGLVTQADVRLLRDAILERPVVRRCPEQVARGGWVLVQGWFPDTVPGVILGGRVQSVATATPRGLLFRVDSGQVPGLQTLVLAYGTERPIDCPVTVR